MFRGGGLNASPYGSLFGRRTIICGWYTWRAVEQGRRRNVDPYVKCDRLPRPRSSPKDTLEICTRCSVDLTKGNLNKTNHFERIGVSASHGCL